MKKATITESTLFLIILTAVGGYINAYGSFVRGFMPNGMTRNMTLIGMNLAQGNTAGIVQSVIPITGIIIGAVVCEYIRNRFKSEQMLLLFEGFCFLLLAVLPDTTPAFPGNLYICFIAGYQLCMFRRSGFGAFNTTICTGNLRSVGQHVYEFLSKRNMESAMRMLTFIILVFSFSLGALLGSWAVMLWGKAAAFAGTAVMFMLAGAVEIESRRNTEAVHSKKEYNQQNKAEFHAA